MLLADFFHRRVEFYPLVLPVLDVPDLGDGVEDSRIGHDDGVDAARAKSGRLAIWVSSYMQLLDLRYALLRITTTHLPAPIAGGLTE